jgi:hypothetical protein
LGITKRRSTHAFATAKPEHFAFAVRAASGLLGPLNAFIRENRVRY